MFKWLSNLLFGSPNPFSGNPYDTDGTVPPEKKKPRMSPPPPKKRSETASRPVRSSMPAPQHHYDGYMTGYLHGTLLGGDTHHHHHDVTPSHDPTPSIDHSPSYGSDSASSDSPADYSGGSDSFSDSGGSFDSFSGD